MNCRLCGSCGEFLQVSSFSKRQWKIKTWRRRCIPCTEHGMELQDSDPSPRGGHDGTLQEDEASSFLNLGRGTNDTSRSSIGSIGNTFPVPPRPIEKIIGRVRASSAPTKKVVEELLHALEYEIASEEHRKVIEQLSSDTNASTAKKDPPVTYETPNMVKLGVTPLLFGTNKHDLPFQFKKMHLPKQEVNVLRENNMGEHDEQKTWVGAEVLAVHLEKTERQNPFILYIGECNIADQDLWDFAVQFRRGSGRFLWPGYYAVLQCPFCGELACPSKQPKNGDENSYVMVCQFIMQACNDGSCPQRALPRLCCRSCFVHNHRPNGVWWGEYRPVGAMMHNLIHLHLDPQHHLRHQHSSAEQNSHISAYTLSNLFETSGMCMAASHLMMDVMASSLSGSPTGRQGGGTYKARMSKSKTNKNRQQPVVRLKVVEDKKKCSGCGIVTTKTSSCSACKIVYYCGRECQRRHWKRHKNYCINVGSSGDGKIEEPRPSREIIVRKKGKSMKDSDENVKLCDACGKNRDDEGGNPAMCFLCGCFICCGPCFGKPEMNGVNGEPAVLSTVCLTCRDTLDGSEELEPGDMLLELLRKKPIGRHINHARLIRAQWMLCDTEEMTGIRQDTAAAMDEFLWLANDCDYAPAQLALAGFHDPVCRQDGCAPWDGPSPIHDMEVPFPTIPFPVDVKIAKMYYTRACEQKHSHALEAVGTMYKSGEGIFPRDTSKAIEMLREAGKMGRSKAMANLARLHMWNGRIDEAMDLFVRAANYGNYMSMFTVAQCGAEKSQWAKDGKTYIKILVDLGWAPMVKGGYELIRDVAAAYGITYDFDQVQVETLPRSMWSRFSSALLFLIGVIMIIKICTV